MSTKIIIGPGKYVQGPNELRKLKKYTKPLGKKVFIIADDFVKKMIDGSVKSNYSKNEFVLETFKGECSKTEIQRLKKIAVAKKCDCVVGIGGGKTFDTAKAIAFYMDVPAVIVPTIASTDAPCSALSVLYTEKGVFDKYLLLPRNPAVVLVDTNIIAKAPVRLLVSGMGDALATYFEARATLRSNGKTMAGDVPTLAGTALAKLCYETLLSDGLKAKLAVNKQVSNLAVENVIEANTYLSGVGFESGGLAAAHAVHNGLTELEACHKFYHGEKVAFGTIVQLVLENAPLEEIQTVIDFCKSVGLPTNLSDLNIADVSKRDLTRVAKTATAEGETIHNMPFPITAELVYAAIVTADQLGA